MPWTSQFSWAVPSNSSVRSTWILSLWLLNGLTSTCSSSTRDSMTTFECAPNGSPSLPLSWLTWKLKSVIQLHWRSPNAHLLLFSEKQITKPLQLRASPQLAVSVHFSRVPEPTNALNLAYIFLSITPCNKKNMSSVNQVHFPIFLQILNIFW